MLCLPQAADEQGRNETTSLPHMGILVFGDSVDYRLPKFLCNVALRLDPAPFNRDSAPDPFYFAGARRAPQIPPHANRWGGPGMLLTLASACRHVQPAQADGGEAAHLWGSA